MRAKFTAQEGQVACKQLQHRYLSISVIIAPIFTDLIYTICLEKSLPSLWSSYQVSFNLKSYFCAVQFAIGIYCYIYLQ